MGASDQISAAEANLRQAKERLAKYKPSDPNYAGAKRDVEMRKKQLADVKKRAKK